jgi:hypothetical protein
MISGGNQDIYEWATEEANREDTKGIKLVPIFSWCKRELHQVHNIDPANEIVCRS